MNPDDEPQCFNDHTHGPAAGSRQVRPGVDILLCQRCLNTIKKA